MTVVPQHKPKTAPAREEQTDELLVDLARNRDEAAIRALIKRHNQKLFRVARAVLRDDAEAEDVVQAAYVKAFTHLDGFRGDARFTTWLTRIALNEALGRRRSRRPTVGLEEVDLADPASAEIIQFPGLRKEADPEAEMSRLELRQMLERAIDLLPDGFRSVFILREVEGLSVEETAETLEIKSETVRSRLHRARLLMRQAIEAELSDAFVSLFPFDGERCVGMADRVMADLNAHWR